MLHLRQDFLTFFLFLDVNGGNVWQHMLTRMPMGIIMHALFSLVLLTIHKSRTNHNQESIKYTVDE